MPTVGIAEFMTQSIDPPATKPILVTALCAKDFHFQELSGCLLNEKGRAAQDCEVALTTVDEGDWLKPKTMTPPIGAGVCFGWQSNETETLEPDLKFVYDENVTRQEFGFLEC